MTKKKIILLVMTIIFISLVVVYKTVFSFNKVELTASEDELNIDNEEIDKVINQYKKPDVVYATLENNDENDKDVDILPENIINIALFGLDSRSESEKGVRADSIMIATIDLNNEKIKLTSLMRDQYVDIQGYGKDKLNHAYAFGGPTLMIQTMNQNFGTNITDYASVNFFSFQRIIDKLGGIEVNLTKDELRLVNKHAAEVARIQGVPYTPLTDTQFAKLDGLQTVAYSRIRMTGNGDIERAERQREVLDQLFRKVKHSSIIELTSLWKEAGSNIQTSLSDFEILNYAKHILSFEDKHIYQSRYPKDGTWKGFRDNRGVWYMNVDLEKQKEDIMNWLYLDNQI